MGYPHFRKPPDIFLVHRDAKKGHKLVTEMVEAANHRLKGLRYRGSPKMLCLVQSFCMFRTSRPCDLVWPSCIIMVYNVTFSNVPILVSWIPHARPCALLQEVVVWICWTWQSMAWKRFLGRLTSKIQGMIVGYQQNMGIDMEKSWDMMRIKKKQHSWSCSQRLQDSIPLLFSVVIIYPFADGLVIFRNLYALLTVFTALYDTRPHLVSPYWQFEEKTVGSSCSR